MRKLAIFLAAIIAAAVVWAFLAPSLARRLVTEKPLARADAIIVLSGSTAYEERTTKAAELFTRGVAARIYLTDDGERAGWSQAEQTNLAFIELARRRLIENGVPVDAIKILPGLVTGTESEASAMALEAGKSEIRSVVIVTSPYHTRRSLRTFEKALGIDVTVGIEHSPITHDSPTPEFWWLRPNGWNSVGAEYVKSAVYYVYY